MSAAKGSTAVRAQKRRLSDGTPWQRHELFPTPPWATRALCEIVLPRMGETGSLGSVWEPCAGLGHMSAVLANYADVRATDIAAYPLSEGGDCDSAGYVQRADFFAIEYRPDWIVTNPPFGLAEKMLPRMQALARVGVALLLRTQWIETSGRYRDIFDARPPSLFAPFAERVAMCEGGFDPKCKTATSYAWFVWRRDGGAWRRQHVSKTFPTMIIEPCRAALTRPQDSLLAARCVPGFVPPSTLRKTGKNQRNLL